MTAHADDPLIPVSKAASLFPGNPKPQTIARWITVGAKVNGRTVQLRGVRAGRTWFVCRAFAEQFASDCTAAAGCPRPAAERKRLDAEAASRKAAALAAWSA